MMKMMIAKQIKVTVQKVKIKITLKKKKTPRIKTYKTNNSFKMPDLKKCHNLRIEPISELILMVLGRNPIIMSF